MVNQATAKLHWSVNSFCLYHKMWIAVLFFDTNRLWLLQTSLWTGLLQRHDVMLQRRIFLLNQKRLWFMFKATKLQWWYHNTDLLILLYYLPNLSCPIIQFGWRVNHLIEFHLMKEVHMISSVCFIHSYYAMCTVFVLLWKTRRVHFKVLKPLCFSAFLISPLCKECSVLNTNDSPMMESVHVCPCRSLSVWKRTSVSWLLAATSGYSSCRRWRWSTLNWTTSWWESASTWSG